MKSAKKKILKDAPLTQGIGFARLRSSEHRLAQRYSALESTRQTGIKMATAREVSFGLKKALTERTAGTGTMEEMMAGDLAVLAPTPAAIFGYSCAGPRSQSSDCGPGVTTRQMLQDTQNDTSGELPALDQMIAKLKAGDSVRMPSFDHLAQTLTDLKNRIKQITASGAIISFQAEGLNFKAAQTDPVSALQFQMLEAFATFEYATQKHQP